jgi:hypothetical protein
MTTFAGHSKCTCPAGTAAPVSIYSHDYVDKITGTMVYGSSHWRCSGCNVSWIVEPDGTSTVVDIQRKTER